MERIEVNKSIVEELLENGEIISVGKGMSMYPMLVPSRNLIRIRSVDRPLKKYDVVLFIYKGRYMLHRIIRVNENTYDICGDYSIGAEMNVAESDILGRLEAFIRKTKEPLNSQPRWVKTDNPMYVMYSHLVVALMPLRVFLLKKLNKRTNKRKKDV